LPRSQEPTTISHPEADEFGQCSHVLLLEDPSALRSPTLSLPIRFSQYDWKMLQKQKHNTVWTMPSSGMWRSVDIVYTDVS
jgi:hypothetical protein